jgi:hypothetical protein
MKCPFKYSKYISERDEACQGDCALAMHETITHEGNRDIYHCAFSVIAWALAQGAQLSEWGAEYGINFQEVNDE